MAFRGFPDDALAFFAELEADNTKVFWTANKARYDTAIKRPMAELVAELDDVGPFHIFRPHNDVRFAKGRPPYKTAIGAHSESEGGTGYYVSLSAAGLMAGAGYYFMRPDQLTKFRSAVDDDVTGPQIGAICDTLTESGFSIGASDSLKTAPRGYPKDHPRVELLRRKGLAATRVFAPAAWLRTAKTVGRIRETWQALAPLSHWLDSHVGPSTLAPEDAERY